MNATNDAPDDDMEWDEVVPDAPNGDIVIEFDEPSASTTAQKGDAKGKGSGRKLDEAEKARINAERQARIDSHKIHTVALLANAAIRNKWLNDELLHARLMSLTPLPLQIHFDMITKKNQPDKALRGRQFEAALTRLADWWYQNFDVEEGKNTHVKSRTFAEVQLELREKGLLPGGDAPPPPPPPLKQSKGKGKAKQVDAEEEDIGEIIRSEKSLMKHALMMRGSRDTSAQLFTALCRTLGIPARLVVSLQSVPWRSSTGKKATSKPKKVDNGKRKEKAPPVEDSFDDSDDDDMEEVIIPGFEDLAYDSSNDKPAKDGSSPKNKGKVTQRFPGAGKTLSGKPGPSTTTASAARDRIVHLRRQKPIGRRLNEGPNQPGPPVEGWPPVFWTEVFSRPDGRWIPVDPVRNLVNRRKRFEPPPHDRNNRMVYVVALEEDGYGRDVTPRYAKEFGAKTSKIRMKGSGNWWEGLMHLITRPYRLNRDDVEDAELVSNQMTEGMPTSLAGFKDHPLYVLERHLHQNQVVHPPTVIGRFRGEPVYPRGNVVELKTAENWMRSEGREVREGEQPMKLVKVRAVTTARRRAIEMQAAEIAGDGAQQGLYAEWQTKIYIPLPVIDGRVPKNDFGNIDLYTPSMLPKGAVHLPYKNIAKVARKLGIDHAEAVTGFEFKQRRAFPVLTGIIVAEEHEEALLEAYWETEQAAEEKERQKRQDRVFKRWERLIKGLTIRERLLKEYSVKDTGQKLPDAPEEEEDPAEAGGGFLVDRTQTDVVQKFSLPKMPHPVVKHAVVDKDREVDEEGPYQPPHEAAAGPSSWSLVEEGGEADDEEMEVVPAEPAPPNVIKSMAELAAAAERESTASTPSAEIVTPSKTANYSLRSRKSTNGKATNTGTSTPASTTSKGRKTSGRKRHRKSFSSEDAEDEEDEESDFSEGTAAGKKGKSARKPRRVPLDASAPTPPTTTKALRSRKPKTEEQLRQERENERAYRTAVAD